MCVCVRVCVSQAENLFFRSINEHVYMYSPACIIIQRVCLYCCNILALMQIAMDISCFIRGEYAYNLSTTFCCAFSIYYSLQSVMCVC